MNIILKNQNFHDTLHMYTHIYIFRRHIYKHVIYIYKLYV